MSEEHLERASDRQRRSVVVVACAWVDTGPLGLVSGLSAATALVGGVLASALVQTYFARRRR